MDAKSINDKFKDTKAKFVKSNSKPNAKSHAKPKSAKQKRERNQKILAVIRFAVQVIFFVSLPGLFSAGFNGFKYLFTSVGTNAPIEATSFLLTLVLLLAVTILFGRVFCGWACAFGTLGDVLHGVFNAVWKRTPFSPLVFPEKLVRVLSFLKYVVLAFVAVACFTGFWSYVAPDSPWTAFAGILAGSIDNIAVAAFVILGLLALGMMVRERFFCQFFCPLGAIFTLMPAVGPLGVTRNPEKCPANCGQCKKHCPVSIWPDPDGLCAGECISCGRCVAVCPLNNISVCSYGKKRTLEANYELTYTPRRKAYSEMGTLFAPAALTGILVLATVNTHEPLVFDAANYQPPNPDVSQLQLLELPASKSGVATLEITLPEKAKAGRLRNGIYVGEALCGEGNDEDWKPYYLLVEVEVKDGRVAGITNIYGDAASTVDPNYWYDSVENGIYLKRAIEGTGGRFTKGALEQITTFLESGEEVGGVDTVSGSTYSVVSIVQAYNRAVADAVSAS